MRKDCKFWGKEFLNSLGQRTNLYLLMIIVWLENNIEFPLVVDLRRS